MKNFTEMKFGEYTFLHNPKSISFSNKLNGVKNIYPYQCSNYSALITDNTVISGNGKITGDNRFYKLLSLLECLDGNERLLSISPFPSVRAVLTSLDYTIGAEDGVIEISFVFTCSTSKAATDDTLPLSVTADGEETLWDISYKYNIPVEALLALNTFVKRPDELKKGWVIKLC